MMADAFQPQPQPAQPDATPDYPVNERGRIYDPSVTDDERSWAALIHLSLLAHVVLTVIAFAIPIVMWQVKKDNSVFIDDHGMEAVNFQISLAILSVLLIPIGILTCSAGFFLYIPLYVVALVAMVQAAMAANRGEFFRYPMNFRLIK
jgi:uncharacterized Tic20 family protein